MKLLACILDLDPPSFGVACKITVVCLSGLSICPSVCPTDSWGFSSGKVLYFFFLIICAMVDNWNIKKLSGLSVCPSVCPTDSSWGFSSGKVLSFFFSDYLRDGR